MMRRPQQANELTKFAQRLDRDQEALAEPFASILYDNLFDLYARDDAIAETAATIPPPQSDNPLK